jgi:hypothetical protein
MKRTGMGLALIFSISISSLFPTSVQADDNSNQYLRVKYTTITNPVIQTSASPQDVTFTANIQTDVYQLKAGDLECSDGQSQVGAIIKQIATNEFSASCTYTYDSSSKAGLRTIFLTNNVFSPNYVAPGRPILKLIPANAKVIYPIKEKDSFGLDVIKNIYAFNMFARMNFWVTAPLAINPPQAFKYPNFPKNSDQYVIFDARKPAPATFKVSINKKSKTFSVSCADQSIPGLSNETRIYRKELIWGAWGPFSISTGKSVNNIPYLTSDTKGKKLDMSCSYFINLKNPVFEGIQVAYVESAVRSVQFPKN